MSDRAITDFQERLAASVEKLAAEIGFIAQRRDFDSTEQLQRSVLSDIKFILTSKNSPTTHIRDGSVPGS